MDSTSFKVLHRLVTILLGLAVLLAGGCHRDAPRQATVVVAVDTSPWASPVYVAAAEGYFAKEGLNVKLVQFSAGKLAMNSLLAGQAQFATVSSIPITFALMNHEDLRVAGTFMESQAAMKVVARRTSGIMTPTDLKGKRVATLLGSAGDFYLDKFLSAHGLSRVDVKVVNLQLPNAVTAIDRGDIDAFVGWEPYVYEAMDTLGKNGITFVDSQLYTFTFNLVTSPKQTATNPVTIREFIAALLDAEEYIHANRSESISVVSQDIGMRPSDLSAVWDDFSFTVELDQTMLQNFQQEAQWTLTSGNVPMGTTIPDFRRFVYPDPLSILRPDRVNYK